MIVVRWVATTTGHITGITAEPIRYLPMISIDTVLLKVASRCNLDCTYCYVYHLGDSRWQSQPKRLPPNVEDAVVSQLARLAAVQVRPFSIVFHGGEPLLLGVKRLFRIFARLRARLPIACGLHLQTNGILLSDAIIDACAAYKVGIRQLGRPA